MTVPARLSYLDSESANFTESKTTRQGGFFLFRLQITLKFIYSSNVYMLTYKHVYLFMCIHAYMHTYNSSLDHLKFNSDLFPSNINSWGSL